MSDKKLYHGTKWEPEPHCTDWGMADWSVDILNNYRTTLKARMRWMVDNEMPTFAGVLAQELERVELELLKVVGDPLPEPHAEVAV